MLIDFPPALLTPPFTPYTRHPPTSIHPPIPNIGLDPGVFDDDIGIVRRIFWLGMFAAGATHMHARTRGRAFTRAWSEHTPLRGRGLFVARATYVCACACACARAPSHTEPLLD